ncbi:uncharacterized protein [Montipora capricornis]|uniref:uncharacterized protein isoform X1 n=1 Tax=Montipora capricornis TaxID=246305 RepID=UPI0035F0FE24
MLTLSGMFCVFIPLSLLQVQIVVCLQAETIYHPDLRQDTYTKNEFHYLSAPVVGMYTVADVFDCSFECSSSPRCFSFNLATHQGADGNLWCELLSSDQYRSDPKDFQRNQTSHHFLKKGPCTPPPCQNGGTCVPRHQALECRCKKGFFGEFCENLKAFNSCKAFYEIYRLNGSQVVNLTLDSQQTPVLCQMGDGRCGDGVWTPVMKIDGSQSTFRFQSALWSSKLSYKPSGGLTGFDDQETKLPTYWTTAFSEICLGMRKGKEEVRFIVISEKADSLHSLIADGTFRSTSVTRSKWVSLMLGSLSLQPNCNREGFNAPCAGHKVRIGILGNNEKDCSSCDSLMGFGLLSGKTCGEHGTATMGYIFVK